jgi:hypothetical protein
MMYDLWGEPIVEELKKCVKCGEEKLLSAYTKASGGNYHRTSCKECETKLTKDRQALREQHKHTYPNDEYQCPICQRKEEIVRGSGGKKVGSWCCDHNHRTGEFRGWLCHDCNRALGNFKENKHNLKRALEWLEKHE